MAKAVMMGITYHANDPTNPAQVLVLATFRFIGLTQDLGTLDATVTFDSTDTQATINTKIQNAIIARAAEYGVPLATTDLIPVVRGVPQSLMSPTSSVTLTATDDGVNQQFIGSLGALKFQAAVGPTLEITNVGFPCIAMDFGGGRLIRIGLSGLYSGADLTFQGLAGAAGDYTAFEGGGGAGVIIATSSGAAPISIRPNRTEVANFDANGLNMAAGVQVKSVAKQTYTVTNPVTDRAYNTTSTTLTEVAQVLGTVIADLKTIGVFA